MSDATAIFSLPDNAPRPRLCRVTKWADFDGYGFNLHAEKSKPGQFIGKVDVDSPAEAAGLREGDRIIEVNGVNINHENHKQVVQRIKALPNETSLLVVDKEAEMFYKQNEIIVTGAMRNISIRSSDPDDEVEEDIHHHHDSDSNHLGQQESRSGSGSPMTTTPDGVLSHHGGARQQEQQSYHHHDEDSDRRSNDGSVASVVSSEKVKSCPVINPTAALCAPLKIT